MRVAALASLCAGILLSHEAAAAETRGGLGPRLPDALAALSAGFYPSAPALTEISLSQP